MQRHAASFPVACNPRFHGGACKTQDAYDRLLCCVDGFGGDMRLGEVKNLSHGT